MDRDQFLSTSDALDIPRRIAQVHSAVSLRFLMSFFLLSTFQIFILYSNRPEIVFCVEATYENNFFKSIKTLYCRTSTTVFTISMTSPNCPRCLIEALNLSRKPTRIAFIVFLPLIQSRLLPIACTTTLDLVTKKISPTLTLSTWTGSEPAMKIELVTSIFHSRNTKKKIVVILFLIKPPVRGAQMVLQTRPKPLSASKALVLSVFKVTTIWRGSAPPNSRRPIRVLIF